MKSIAKVQYLGGPSRYHPNAAVDYMLVVIDGHELYAEAEPTDDETVTYEDLKAQILEQAAEYGIDPSQLQFHFD